MSQIKSEIDTVGFFSNMLAVILGIVITFSIQGIINRHSQRENIRSALRLVEEELQSCRQDLSSCADFVEIERVAASYLKSNLNHLRACPADSVSQYGMAFISEMILTLPDDALELLKTSSLFPAIDNNELSLAIIGAYDQFNAMRLVFNRHEEQKSDILKQIFVEKGMEKCLYPDGSISISEVMNTKNGMYLSSQLLGGTADTFRAGFSDIDTAIKMIDKYLKYSANRQNGLPRSICNSEGVLGRLQIN